MNELTKIKKHILSELRGLCAHCATGSSRVHHCPVKEISVRVESISGVPLIVNSQFKGVLFSRV